MPIYEYHCPKCGTFETMQRITEPSLKRCPTCKSKVERMMSRTSFVLKGSGWYATDYARAGAKPADDSGEKSGEKPSEASAGNGSSTNGSSTAPSSDGGSSSGSSAKGGSDKSAARKTGSGSSEKTGSSSPEKSSEKSGSSSSEKSAGGKSSD